MKNKSYKSYLRISKASFQQNGGKAGGVSSKSVTQDGYLKNGTIVGNKGIDLLLSVEEGGKFDTEIYTGKEGIQYLRVRAIPA